MGIPQSTRLKEIMRWWDEGISKMGIGMVDTYEA
jgi:hypothetical protein